MLDEAQKSEYALIEIQAKHKAGEDISEETDIFQARNYFLGKEDYEKAALAYYYSGKVYSTRGDNETAMRNYLKAKELVEKTKNDNLKGMIYFDIGYLYYIDSNYHQAIAYFRKAQPYFEKANNLAHEISSLLMIGNCLYLNEDGFNTDSAFQIYHSALDLAISKNDSALISASMQNIAVMYRQGGDYEQAINNFIKASPYAITDEERSRNYIHLAETYLQMDQLDSAGYYGKKGLEQLATVKQLNDDSFLAYAYGRFSEIEEKMENYQQALAYKNLSFYYNDSIYSKILDQKISIINQKNEYELLLNEANRWNQTRRISFIIIILLVFCIMAALYFVHKYRINQLQAIRDFNELKNLMSSEVRLKGLNIMKEIALLEDMIDDKIREKEFKKRLKDAISKINWDTLFPMLNELHRDVFEKLKKDAACLNEDEFKIVCLDYSGFHNEEIAKILRLKQNTITTKKTKIRQKLGMENNTNIQEFISNCYASA